MVLKMMTAPKAEEYRQPLKATKSRGDRFPLELPEEM